jgi:hypothetical protein
VVSVISIHIGSSKIVDSKVGQDRLDAVFGVSVSKKKQELPVVRHAANLKDVIGPGKIDDQQQGELCGTVPKRNICPQ